MKDGKLCLKTKTYSGAEVIFTETQRSLKALTHPELRDLTFISGRLKNAINEPNFVSSGPFFVVTAFRPNYVKERDKTKLIYGKDK